mmetsp:Transcript_60586/g.136340  ORF Transcript_60586/g.136340 Transcript_60586/m.136340 type:complete len:244 (+) Transcript_60586:123-854(+)
MLVALAALLLSSLPGALGTQKFGLRHRQPEDNFFLGWSAPVLTSADGPSPAPSPNMLSPSPAVYMPWPEWPGLVAPPPSPAAPAAAPSSGLVIAPPDACSQLASLIKAMSCSNVTQVTGSKDGCECRMEGSVCPAAHAGLGFTAVSPSSPIRLPEEETTVILCMYWQLHAAPSQAVELRARQRKAESWAMDLVLQARTNAEKQADSLEPTTAPPPAQADVGANWLLDAAPAPAPSGTLAASTR